MNMLVRVLSPASALSLGLFAGAMLTEGFVLVPYWRSLPAAQFLSWYVAEGPRLVDFFGPVTWLAGLSALGAAVAAVWSRAPGRGASVLAAGLMLAAVATFFLYFERANASFAAGTLDGAALARELERWSHWHHARTLLGLAALAAALLALRGDAPRPESQTFSPPWAHGTPSVPIGCQRQRRSVPLQSSQSWHS